MRILGTLRAVLGAVAGSHRQFLLPTQLSTVQLFAPSCSAVVHGATVASGTTLAPPLLIPGVLGATVTSTAVTYAAQMAYAVVCTTLVTTTTLSPPTLAAVNMTPTVGSTVTLYPVVVLSEQTLVAATIAATSTSTAPRLSYTQFVVGGVLPASGGVFAPLLFMSGPFMVDSPVVVNTLRVSAINCRELVTVDEMRVARVITADPVEV